MIKEWRLLPRAMPRRWTAFDTVIHVGREQLTRAVVVPERTFMTGWVILVDQPKDLPNADTPHKVITTSEYPTWPRLFDVGRPKLVNLARSYSLSVEGLLRFAPGRSARHMVMPAVETMLELREVKLYEHALPELEDDLNRCTRRAHFQTEGRAQTSGLFGISRDPRFESFGRLLLTGSALRRLR